jgi:hypothetical protein
VVRYWSQQDLPTDAKHFLHPALHFLSTHIFLVRPEAPLKSEWINERADAVTVKLIFHRPFYACTGAHRLFKCGIRVFDVHHKACWRPAQRFRALVPVSWHFIGHHYSRVGNFNLGMSDTAVRRSLIAEFPWHRKRAGRT